MIVNDYFAISVMSNSPSPEQKIEANTFVLLEQHDFNRCVMFFVHTNASFVTPNCAVLTFIISQ